MSKETAIFKSIWIGKTYVSIGDVKQKGEELSFKKIGGLPILNPFVPVMANADQIPYQERELYTPNHGSTGERVRIYMADLRLDKYYAMTNPQDLTAIAHLKAENLSLKNHMEQLYNMLHDLSNEDRLTKKIKKMREQYNAIMGFGTGGGYNSFGGGGFGGLPTPSPDMGGGDMGGEHPF